MPDWSTTELCTDADIQRFESAWPQRWTDDSDTWRQTAKDRIESRLRHALREKELETDAADVLDLIFNASELKDAACFKTLELCAEANVQDTGDYYHRKKEEYRRDFEDEFPRAVAMLHFDLDEDAAISDSEKYSVNYGIEISRGG